MKRRGISGLNRRQFLTTSGGAVAGALLAGQAQAWPWPQRAPRILQPRTQRRAKIALVFSHIPRGRPTWPTKDYDYDARRQQLTEALERRCRNTDFKVCVAHSQQEAQNILKESPNVDGFVVYMIGIWTGVKNTIMTSGKPTVVVDDLYAGSGEMLGVGPLIRKENFRAGMVSSSNLDDVARGVRWIETIVAMKDAKIVNARDRDISGQTKDLRDVLGTTMIPVKADEIQRCYKNADDGEARQWADYWIKGASAVRWKETTRKKIFQAGKTHVALCNLLADNQADCVTMDCLTFVYANKIEGYPCLSFFELLNQGLTGVCESDVDSTATFLLMRYLTGRPGFISDPVIDTSTSEIIYAHCLGTNRVFGPEGKTNKYIIRSHAEDEEGASVQSLMPLGEPVTTLRLSLGDRHLLVHTAATTRNVDEPKACRTKLAAKADADQLLRNWTRGWHRVTVYGDWRNDIINLGQMLGLTVIEEDKPIVQV